MIENYESNPGPFSFVCECPVDWDKTVYPEAEIGKYITVARKDKNSDSWYIGSATGTDARTARIPLAFLDSGCTYRATIYRDAPEDCSRDVRPQARTFPGELFQQPCGDCGSLSAVLQ